jgi:hypothetical protein
VSQFVAERSAILLVLVIKLTRRRDRGIEEGGSKDVEIGRDRLKREGVKRLFIV